MSSAGRKADLDADGCHGQDALRPNSFMIEAHSTFAISEKPEIGLRPAVALLADAGGGRPLPGACCARRRGAVARDLRLQVVGELIHDLRGGGLDHADAAAVLRDRARQREIGVHQNLRAAGRRVVDTERRHRIGAAAALGVGALRLHARGAVGVVDLLERHQPGEGERHRAEPHRDLALVVLARRRPR